MFLNIIENKDVKKSALNARLHIFLCLVFRKRELCWLKANVIISAQ